MSRERFDHEDLGKKIKGEIDASNCQMGIGRHILGSSPLNKITPCAACKLLRRRCAEECPFSPYFSPHQPQNFAAVHKVFGARNVSKMLMEVPETQRSDAASSLVYEANVRLRDPVYGCMGAISALHQQVQSLQAELRAVRAEILKYKSRESANFAPSGVVSAAVQPRAAPPPPPPPPPPPSPLPATSFIVVATDSSSASVYTLSDSTIGYNSNVPSDGVPYFDD